MILKSFYCVLLAVLMGVPVLGASLQISPKADPWNVTINGPDIVFAGLMSEFTCLTSCNISVECTVKWQFRGGLPSGSTSINNNVFKWTPSKAGIFQNFTCIAENAASGLSAQDTKMVEVREKVNPTGPPSGSEVVHAHGVSTVILSLGLLVLFDL